jgi:hypothetical protein
VSINGNWLRVTPAELSGALADLPAAQDLAVLAIRAGSDRWQGSGGTWQALDYLFDRYGIHGPIVGSDRSCAPGYDEFEDDGEGIDWGYGPPSYLTPAEVGMAAAGLATVTGDDLLRGVTPDDLAGAEIYPNHWAPRDLPWAVHYLPEIRDFFATAAKEGDAVLCWLD